ncbi:hypothetical protein BGS_0972 [Beggiatoa sp. SS]|nr:hypothetical protein BGS_0972 [Beggiatoa sp. SS]
MAIFLIHAIDGYKLHIVKGKPFWDWFNEELNRRITVMDNNEFVVILMGIATSAEVWVGVLISLSDYFRT